jgi:diguanylate cyclase (GGDEF)-like protein
MLYPVLLAAALPVMGLAAINVADVPGGGVLTVTTAALAVVLIVRSWLGTVELAHHRVRSITDPVTGTFNQRRLYDSLPRELNEATVTQRPVATLAFDVVDFRDIERMFGTEESDRVLVELADLLRDEAPAGSDIYRVGGDEFIVVAPGRSVAEAVALAHRINARAGSTMFVAGVPIALSAGVAVFPGDGEDADTLVSRALASQQLARSAERADVVAYDAEVVDAADSLARLERSRRQSHRAKLRMLAAAVDARAEQTRHHSEVLGEIASAFALVLELSDEQTHVLETAAQVHDIGKIGVPTEILLKPGQLSPGEREIMDRHPGLGEQLLRPADMPEILPAVRHHHERWDGTGYPDGLSGLDIPFEARVLSLCDSFEAMTHARPYRPALTTAQALAEIERCSGAQFDPMLATAFGRMVERMYGRAVSKRTAAMHRETGRAPESGRAAP